MRRFAAALLLLTAIGCGSSSSPTEPAATPTTPASTFHLADALSGFNTVGGTIVVGGQVITVPVGGAGATVQFPAGTYTMTATGLPAGTYKPTTGNFIVLVAPATNNFTFFLARQ